MVTEESPMEFSEEEIARLTAIRLADRYSQSLMSRYSRAGLLEGVKCLIEIQTPASAYAMGHACYEGRLNIVEYLFSQGHQICPMDMRSAVVHGHLNVIEWLVTHGCRLDRIAYRAAIDHGYPDIARWLEEHGCPLA